MLNLSVSCPSHPRPWGPAAGGGHGSAHGPEGVPGYHCWEGVAVRIAWFGDPVLSLLQECHPFLLEKKKQQQQQQCQGPKAPGDIPVPRFRRGRGESERSYICRMQHEVQRMLFLAENQIQREPEKEGSPTDPHSLADTVPFGEVVTQPPTITSRPRGRGPAEQVSSGDSATHPWVPGRAVVASASR
uniref:Uncharacterized protein n=1 Tax=Zonotrichia albicollis TaxID=44394 RepID=A0A8D2Q9V3_ZONAL